jgi:glyoxylase I family protein
MLGKNKAIGGGGFHHVAMRAKDFEASVKFYKEALGFVEWIRWGQDARATGGGDSRAIMLDTGDGSHLEIFAGGAGAPPEGAYIHVAFNTTDCDAAIARARAAGAKVTMEPKSLTIESIPTPTDVRIAFCTGPDGEVLEFFQKK